MCWLCHPHKVGGKTVNDISPWWGPVSEGIFEAPGSQLQQHLCRTGLGEVTRHTFVAPAVNQLSWLSSVGQKLLLCAGGIADAQLRKLCLMGQHAACCGALLLLMLLLLSCKQSILTAVYILSLDIAHAVLTLWALPSCRSLGTVPSTSWLRPSLPHDLAWPLCRHPLLPCAA